VHWSYRLLDIEFLNLHTAGLSRLNVTVHLFLVNKKVTCQFPRFLGFNELKAEPTQQRWHQLVHLHSGRYSIVNVEIDNYYLSDAYPGTVTERQIVSFHEFRYKFLWLRPENGCISMNSPCMPTID
jgi:hypothetical protein